MKLKNEIASLFNNLDLLTTYYKQTRTHFWETLKKHFISDLREVSVSEKEYLNINIHTAKS